MRLGVRATIVKAHSKGLVRFRNDVARCSFDYNSHLEQLMRLWCQRYRQLQHIDMDRVVVSIVKCRSRRSQGVYATITSLRYPCGRAWDNGNRTVRTLPRMVKADKEALYLVKFYLPRFQNLTTEEKASTILHELNHIDPKFNGELRDFGGKHWAHGSSQSAFEKMYEPVLHDVMKYRDPLKELFLDCSFRALLKRYGNIYGARFRVKADFLESLPTVA